MRLAIGIFMALILMGALFGQWEPEINISNTPDTASFTSPNNARSIAASGNFVHAVWQEGSSIYGNIFYKRSINNGDSWPDRYLRHLTTHHLASDPAVAVSGFYVHCVWCDDQNDRSEIYYRRSTDAGVSWERRVSCLRDNSEDEESESPSIAASDSNVH